MAIFCFISHAEGQSLEGSAEPRAEFAVMRIHVSRRISAEALKSLYATGWDIFVGPDEIPNKKRFVWAAGGCEGLLSLPTETVDGELMDACPDLKVISQCANGVDNIDLLEAKRRGIVVCNTPDALATKLCLAQLAVDNLVAVLRGEEPEHRVV